nr:hypothetical protein [Tanacetum cinerariifolium]
MRRFGKGFSGVDTPLFDGMLLPHQVQDDVTDVVEDEDAVNKISVEPTPPSPTPATTPPPQQELIPSPSQVESTPPSSPHQSPIAQPSLPLPQQPSQHEDISHSAMALLNHLLETCATLTKKEVGKEEKVESFRVKEIEEEGIAELDADEDVTLEEVDAEVSKDTDVQGRFEKSQAQVYHLDLEHAQKVLITTSTTPITTARVPKASVPRRRRVVIIQDPEEAATVSLKQVKRKEKKDNTVMRYQALKRKLVTEVQAKKNMMVYLKNMTGFKMDFFKGEKELEEEDGKRKSKNLEQKAAKKQKIDEEVEELKTHLQIIPNDEDDVYTEATPLALKKIVQERFESSEPKNFLDEFLINALKTMFEKLNVDANIWKNQRGRYGLAKVKSWKLLESCGVYIITFITTQMILLVERRYPWIRFTLEQMLNNVRLEFEEKSEVSLELLRLVRRQPQEGYKPE